MYQNSNNIIDYFEKKSLIIIKRMFEVLERSQTKIDNYKYQKLLSKLKILSESGN